MENKKRTKVHKIFCDYPKKQYERIESKINFQKINIFIFYF
jgi:hypothetical protein